MAVFEGDEFNLGLKRVAVIFIPLLIGFLLVSGITLLFAYGTAQSSLEQAQKNQFSAQQNDSTINPTLYSDTLFMGQDCMSSENWEQCNNNVRGKAVKELWNGVITVNGKVHYLENDQQIANVFQEAPLQGVEWSSLTLESSTPPTLTYSNEEHRVSLSYSESNGRFFFTDMKIEPGKVGE